MLPELFVAAFLQFGEPGEEDLQNLHEEITPIRKSHAAV